MVSYLSEIFFAFLKLGCIAFGGPVAHLSFFRQEFVNKRQWLSDQQYAELVTICQILPGPASSQVGFCLGLYRAGLAGALTAFVAFTLPSVLLLMGVAMASQQLLEHVYFGMVINALKMLVIIVVTNAVWGMFKSFCNSPLTIGIMLFTTSALLFVPLFVPYAWVTIVSIGLSMLCGASFLSKAPTQSQHILLFKISKPFSNFCLVLFTTGLVGMGWFTEFSLFYNAGAWVFGGGHVVLPLLQESLVAPDIIASAEFVAGYGATQLVPGPIFTFASYLGYILPVDSSFTASPILNSAIATGLIFLPGFLLIIGVLPYWQLLSQQATFSGMIAGASAAVVGVLLAALIDPIVSSSIGNMYYFAATIVCFAISRISHLNVLQTALLCLLANFIFLILT